MNSCASDHPHENTIEHIWADENCALKELRYICVIRSLGRRVEVIENASCV